MRVLFVNQSDSKGGAAIAMGRLATSLREMSVEVEFAVAEGSGTVWEGFQKTVPERLLGKVLWQCGLDQIHTRGSFRLAQSQWLESFDLIHFHNLHSGYFNYLALPQISRKLPIVWTLHDMWSFTGHCAYSMDCEKWKTGCGNCPQLHAYPYMHRDASRLEWKLKDWSYKHSNLHVAAPSRWLADCARQSMLGRHPVHHIPYGLDLEAWRPVDKSKARERFNLPVNAVVLLVVANDLREERKGGRLLLEILGRMAPELKSRCILLTAGHGDPSALRETGFTVHHVGHLTQDADKRALYSAADLMLFTSTADNLPLVLMEAMACALPTIAFSVGGVPDLIQHGVSGRLAAAFDVGEYVRHAEGLIGEPALLGEMGAAACKGMEQHFSTPLEATSYSNVYRNALNAR